MPDIEVGKKFLLTHNDGTLQVFDVGKHSVPQEVADHWFVRAHLRDAPPPVPKIGSVEYALMARAAAEKAVEDAKKFAEKAAEAQSAADEAAKSVIAAGGDVAVAEPNDAEPVMPPKRGPGRPPKSSYLPDG